jgi:hypothetical protein
MYSKKGRNLGLGLVGALITLLLIGGVQATGQAASMVGVEVLPNGLHDDGAGFTLYESDIPADLKADTPCHDVTGYDDELEYDDFCVYYNISDTSTATATDVGDITEEYWDRYVDDFGFLPPLQNHATNKIEVIIVDSVPSTYCNGSAWDNFIKVYNGCFGSEENMRQVIGHELFHRVQMNYDSNWDPDWTDIAWFFEGTARASEDMVFDMVDNWAGAFGVSFSFNREVNEYLAATNNDLTHVNNRYEAALWWKYFSEQFGSETDEPERGIDAFLELWQNADTSNDIAAVNSAMSGLGAGVSFNEAFRKFTAANYTKDLSGLPDGTYNYIDEEQTGNPATYGPIVPASGGTISGTSPSTDWTNRTVNRYSARYYQADVGSNCPVVSASFHRDSGADVFYHVVTQNGTAFGTHREGSGADWTQAFLNDGITKITAVIGGQANSGQVDIEFSCANPVVDIKLPNDGAQARVWRHAAPQRFLAQVLVTDGSPTGPVVAGLTNDDFAVKVNNKLGTIETGGFIQEQYWLVVQAPTQTADGTYDLKVELQEPGTSTEIASDTNTNSIVYDLEHTDHVLVVDSSGSMASDFKLEAAKDAANFYVDIVFPNDGIAAVAYNHNVIAASTWITRAYAAKDDVRTLVDGLTASGATSIGDGLDKAYDLRENFTSTDWPNCSFVLLSDGMENSSLYWSNVMTDVISTGCPVTTIAFGADSDETLMQTIATETGGSYYFNDVFVSSLASADALSPQDMALELGGIYEYAQGMSERRQRLLSVKGTIIPEQTISHTVMIDDSISEALFALDWIGLRASVELVLEKPDGTELNCVEQADAFFNFTSGHLGCRVGIPSADAGEWTLHVTYLGGGTKILPYQLIVSAPSSMFVQMLLPDQLGRQYFTGDFLPLIAMIAGDGPIPNATVETTVKCQGGEETKVMLYDDGQHGDGLAGDGFYGNVFRRTTQASTNPPAAEDGAEILPQPNDEGSCSVGLTAFNGDFQREAIGGFSILEGEDTDPENGVPDTIDEAYGDLTADPDLDELSTYDEWSHGTDAFNSDSDGGGENDYSELILHGSNPFDPSDDMIEAPDFFQTQAQNGAVKLLYDVKDEYIGTKYYYKKAGESEWTLGGTDVLPTTGEFNFTATNGETYYFAFKAYDSDDHWSAVIFSEAVTPSEDPIPPEAHVLINDGAPSTANIDVTLSFVPYETMQPEYNDAFDDIVEMKISNDPSFDGIDWEPFKQDVPWTLSASTGVGEVAKVYVIFKDENDNVSSGVELGQIVYAPELIFLPVVPNGSQ